MKKYFSLIGLFVSVCAFGQDNNLQTIDSIINSKLAENDPGLFVGIVYDGNIIYEKYRGMANLQHSVEADQNTRSNIASTAKQFTALMILQMALDKKLSLEDDIRKYMPDLYPDVSSNIKIRHLINHTSGIRDVYDLMSIQQKPWWRRVGLDNDDVIELLEKQEDLGFEPGSRYMYSNSGYILLTKIIEIASGEDFHDYSNSFFKSLKMDNTGFLENYMYVIPHQALPYSDWGDGVWQEYPMVTNLFGDGFLFTTLKDQLIFEQAIQNATKTNNELLIKSQKMVPNSEITRYGFGLELENRLGRKSIHHSGSTGSYHAQTVRFPNENLSVFVMSNNSRLWSGTIADEIARVLLPKKEAKISYDERIESLSNHSKTSDLVGQYLSPSEYLIRIESDDEKLFWRNANNNPIELNKEKSNLYSFAYNPKLKVGFFNEEFVLFYPSGKANTYTKIPNEEATTADLESFVGDYYSSELDVNFSLELNNSKLVFSFEDWKKKREVEVLNKNELLIYDYILKVERDPFDRVTNILLTTNRVLNNKFTKKTNLIFQPKVKTVNGSINVTTIGSRDDHSSQILLTKNYENGNEIWSKQYGGKSYDKASSIIDTEDGYLIIGSTSSYGNGNYDMFVIKTDKEGKKIWQNSYGEFYNEYGYNAEILDDGFLIKGTIQHCENNTDINKKCKTNVWFVTIDKEGNQIASSILEEVDL